jgi:hypothetical protein
VILQGNLANITQVSVATAVAVSIGGPAIASASAGNIGIIGQSNLVA